jgi:predicted permease
MGWLRFFRRSRWDAERAREIQAYLDIETDDNIARGIPPIEARNAARRRFGNPAYVREEIHLMNSLGFLETIVKDLGYAARMLRRSPGFSAVAILSLALGIGANTAIFTVIHAVLIRPLPYADPNALVTWRGNESLPDIDDIRAQSGAFFSEGGGVNFESMDYSSGAEPIGIHAGYVDAGFFRVFGVPAFMGRTLSSEEDHKDGPRVAVLAYSFWRDVLGGDPQALGKGITLSGNSYTVIGVMPPSFASPGYKLDVFVSLWVAYPEAAAFRGVHFMQTYWRLKPGVTAAQATAGMATIDARLAAAYPASEKDRKTQVVPLQQWITGDVRPALWILFGAVCVVLLIACANFAGLLMARTATRQREMVIRAALGGGRFRLVRQALTESSLLALLGGTGGMLLAKWGIHLLVAAKPAALAHLEGITMDPAVLLFGLAISTLTGLVFGMAPAWSASGASGADTMKQNTRTLTAGPAEYRFRQALVLAEIALAMVLLAGAGLLIKSFGRLHSVDPGFNPAQVLFVPIKLPAKRYADIPKQTAFRRDLLNRLNGLPGVEAAMAGDIPLNGSELTHSLAFYGRPAVAVGDEPSVDTSCVMGDYFRVMQIPLLAGRTFAETDRENQPLVAVINQALARQFFAGQDPIGQRIRWARDEGAPRWMTVVGVVGDVKQFALWQPAFPAVFTPFPQSNEAWRRWMSVVLRVRGPSANIVPAIKREIWSIDHAIPLDRVGAMGELLNLSLGEKRFNMFLLSLFAGLATLLAAVGIYGVMSHITSQRTHEIGIRMAVGASRGDVLRLVIGQSVRLAAAGSASGLLGVLALTRWMRSLLFAVGATDPETLAAVTLLMAAVVLVACFVPAYRAIRVDPLTALRDE